MTGASDENLKFWKAFEKRDKSSGASALGVAGVKAGMKAASSGNGVAGDGDSADDDLVNATRRMHIR